MCLLVVHGYLKVCLKAKIKDKTVRVWDLSGKTSVKVLEHPSDVQCVLLKDNLIISGGSDAVVKLWDMSGYEIASLAGHKSAIKSIDRELSTIVTGSDDTWVKIWYLNKN